MGKLKKIIEIPKERQNMYLQNSEDTLLLKDLEYQLKILFEENKKKQQAHEDYEEYLLEYTKKYSDLENLIREIKERIEKEELEIKGFRVLDKINKFNKLNKDITLLQQQQLALQSSLKGEKTEAIDSVIAQIDENFSKEIELFKLQDMLQEQTKCLIDEQETYNMLHTENRVAYKEKLESLAKTIQEIKKSINKTQAKIEIFKLQDILEKQQQYLVDEKQRYDMLLNLSSIEELTLLAKTIQEIKKSITQIETNIVKKKRELDI
jgi:hypothetical protein